jgi:hypothetical protein
MNEPLFKRSLLLSIGLGWIIGGVEALRIGFSLPWYFDPKETLILMLISLVSGVFLATCIGLVTSAIAGIDKYRHPTRTWTISMTATGFFLSCWVIVPLAFRVWNDGRHGFALGVCTTIALFTFLIWQNADFWLRRSFKKSTRFSWSLLSMGTGFLMVLIGVMAATQKGYGSKRAIETDSDVFVVSIDGLRADAISSIGQDEAMAQTPNLDSLANRCIRYDNAITPHSEVLPAQVSMITGIYPGQTGVIDNDDPFRFQFDTMTEKLAGEGYATAAFLSHPALEHQSGFSQGFQLYDDDRSPFIHGLQEIQLIKLLLQLFGNQEENREASDTLNEASKWLMQYSRTPVFTWIQIQIPDGLTKSQYSQKVVDIDIAVGDFLRKIREREVPRKSLIIVTAAHGMHWDSKIGAHDGISESVVRVPLVICPIEDRAKKVVPQQVRLLDLLNTVYLQLDFSHVKESQSADIVKNISRDSFNGYQIYLMGRDSKSLLQGYVVGYRLQGKNSDYYYKYMWYTTRRQHALYNVTKDPGETTDISREAEEMINTLATSTMKASKSIKGLQIQEVDSKLENVQPVFE